MRPKPHTGYTSLLKGSDFVFQSGFNAWPRTISLQVSTWFRLQHHDLLQPQCLRTHSKRPHLSVVKFLKSVYSVYHPACYLQTAAVTLQNHFVFLLPTTYFVFCTAFNTITSFSVICLHPHTYLILRSCFVQMLPTTYLIRYFSLSRLVSGAEQKIMTDLFVYVKPFWGKYPLNTIFFLKNIRNYFFLLNN